MQNAILGEKYLITSAMLATELELGGQIVSNESLNLIFYEIMGE